MFSFDFQFVGEVFAQRSSCMVLSGDTVEPPKVGCCPKWGAKLVCLVNYS